MSRSRISELIDRLHKKGARVILAVRGNGRRLVGDLVGAPRASEVFLETFLPESDEAIVDWLGTMPEDFRCDRTARAIAMTAYRRACQRLAGGKTTLAPRVPLVGVACITNVRAEAHDPSPAQIHVAYQTASATSALSLDLASDESIPPRRDQIAVELLSAAMAEACGVAFHVDRALVERRTIVRRRTAAPDGWRELLHGRIDRAKANEATPVDELQKAPLIFPGAFNPLHDGHRRMAEVGGQHLGRSVAMELAIENVDKPPLDFIEIADRAAQFTADEPLWLTRAATFVEKARVFPGATFIVGTDTIGRIADPRYYGRDVRALEQALDVIRAANCRFLVFGRQSGDEFQTLGDLQLPVPLAEICDGVSAEQFREDVSSTNLRRGRER